MGVLLNLVDGEEYPGDEPLTRSLGQACRTILIARLVGERVAGGLAARSLGRLERRQWVVRIPGVVLSGDRVGKRGQYGL